MFAALHSIVGSNMGSTQQQACAVQELVCLLCCALVAQKLAQAVIATRNQVLLPAAEIATCMLLAASPLCAAAFYFYAMQPWVHYVPTGFNGLSEIESIVDFLRANDGLARKVGLNSKRFAHVHLGEEGRLCYFKVDCRVHCEAIMLAAMLICTSCLFGSARARQGPWGHGALHCCACCTHLMHQRPEQCRWVPHCPSLCRYFDCCIPTHHEPSTVLPRYYSRRWPG